MKHLPYFLILMFSPFFVTEVKAQIVINEFSSNTSLDWIELYSPIETDISGWILDDQNTQTNMHIVPQGTILSAGGFYVAEVSDRLNKTGDTIYLYDAGNNEINKIYYGGTGQVCTPSDGGSIARIPDGGNTYDRLSVSTKGTTNGVSFTDSCPTSTPDPTSTPTSISTPTSTLTPTTVSTATPTKTPTAVPTKTPSPKPTVIPSSNPEELVLGTQNTTSIPEASFEEETVEEKKFPIFPVILIITGFLCIAGAVFFFIKNNVKKDI